MNTSVASSSIRSSRSHEPSSSSSSGSLLLTSRSNTAPPPSPSSSSSPATAWRWKEAEVEELIARLERSVVRREEEASSKGRGGALVVKDRRWRFRWYPQCFTGVELVDWLLAHEEGPPFCVRTREEAVALGQHLMDQEWITHVVNDREFFDKGFFYQFRMKKKLLTNAGLVSGNGEANLDLGRIAVAMINNITGVPVQDRRWRLKKYPNCFIGKEAADWMSAHLNVDREAAIRVLQQLHKEGLFYHVTNDHTYKDAELFYVFSKQFPSSLSLPLVRDTYWIEWEELDIIQTISQGSDAIVYKGLWCGEEVAIKVVSLPSHASTTNDPRKIEHDQTFSSQPPTMTKTNNSGGGFRFSRTKSTLIRDRSTARVAMLEALDEFKNEIWILSGLHHPNIVSMKGICRNPYAVITEWLPCGDLYRFLHSSSSEDSFLPWSIIWKIAFDIAQGMAYLHSKDIVHSDLKSPNCLVSCLCENSIAVKIADFGLSDRIISKTMQLEKDQQTASTQNATQKTKKKKEE
ncbi:Domain found in Dishevelled, Egl-10, and Pleckstrin [Balamuthia mandrillaris]